MECNRRTAGVQAQGAKVTESSMETRSVYHNTQKELFAHLFGHVCFTQ